MLINFSLLPIQDIAPWGSPGSHSLSWFGLTDGQYWLEAGSSNLFEYSNHAQSLGTKRYCDYQVVRLHEDLLDMLPYILEPVPASLVPHISGETGISWLKKVNQWYDEHENLIPENRLWEVIDAAIGWGGKRCLDNMHLSPSAKIVIWSDPESVHIEWDNREKLIDGQAAWSANLGAHKLLRSEFVHEVESFHTRLMNQMEERVKQVVAGVLNPEISIDFAALVKQHEKRCLSLQSALDVKAETDWSKIEKAIHEVHVDLKDR